MSDMRKIYPSSTSAARLFVLFSALGFINAGCAAVGTKQAMKTGTAARMPAASERELDLTTRVQRYLGSAQQNLTHLSARCLSFSQTTPDVVEVRELHDRFCGGDMQVAPLVSIFTLDGGQLFYNDPATGGRLLALENDKAGADQSAAPMGHYANARFGFSLSFPQNLFAAGSESDNGDGITIQSLDGHAMFRAYGSFAPSVLNKNLAQMYNERLKEPGQKITYKTLNAAKGFFVLSGTKDGHIFYEKTYVLNKVQKTFEIDYDRAQKVIFDDVAAQVANGFQPN
jgi:hypothetical protein